jgi:hypothetical protein
VEHGDPAGERSEDHGAARELGTAHAFGELPPAERCREGDRRGHREAKQECALKEEELALSQRGLRDQYGKPSADAARGYCGDHLDHRGELRPERDQLGAAANREDLVEGGAAGESDGDDREGQGELRTRLF